MFRFQLCLTDDTPGKQINCVWLPQGFKSDPSSFFSWLDGLCQAVDYSTISDDQELSEALFFSNKKSKELRQMD